LLAGEMKLHFILRDAPGGTHVTVRHEGIPARISVEDNERGTASSLENLARLIEGR
jgi:Activator of Hsp90 ATPase homolog 1-like protein